MIDKKKPVFRAIFSVEPAVRIGKEMKLSFDYGELILKEIIHSEMGIAKSLLFDVTLNSTDCETAISSARGVVIRALDWISFLTATSLSNPRILKCYDVTPKRTEGKFERYYYIDFLDPISTRQSDSTEMSLSYESILKHSESHQDRLYRAMHWYRLAIQSEDYLDKFTLTWIGLETLNPPLKEYYKLDSKYRNFDGDEVDFDKCLTCKRKTVKALNGMDHLLTEVAENEEFLRKVKRLRQETLHGHGRLKDITPKLKRLYPILATTLDKGLRLLLGLSNRTDLKPLNLWKITPKYYRLEASIKGPNLGLLDKKVIPSLDMEISTLGYKQGAQGYKLGEVKEIIDSKFTFNDIKHYESENEAFGNRFEYTPLPDVDDE